MLGNTGGNKKFLTIVQGRWTLRVPEGTEGAVERVNKVGDTVNELQFSYVDGYVAGGRIKQGQFGSTVEIDLQDGDETYLVQIPVPEAGGIGDYFMSFGKACPNIDPTKKLFLGLGYDREDDRSFLYLKQDGNTVHSAFTKENPNGMPQWEKKEVMGKVKWNADEQNEFLYGQIVDFFALVGDEVVAEVVTPEVIAPATPLPIDLDDDIPF